MRKPNEKCEVCGKEFYRRPSQRRNFVHAFCSWDCYNVERGVPARRCEFCGNEYKYTKKTQRFCCKVCSAKGSRGGWSTTPKGALRDQSKIRLVKLRDVFGFTHCMVQGCTYSTTYDIHRYVRGKDGGRYIIGNMFAICPNHHAEITRKITVVEKVSDCELRIVGEGCAK